jgi:GNAT superfamily N-acetyltransferase
VLLGRLGDADTSYDHTGDCVHFLATAGGQPAGTVRLVPSKGKLTRLAVLAPLRSTGAGRELVRAMEEWLVREVRAGRMQHLVTEGRAGRAVHVKIHSQVGCGAPRTPRTGRECPERSALTPDPRYQVLRQTRVSRGGAAL